MVGIGLRLGVAIRALEYGIVGRVGMARRADTVGPAVVCREPSVVEGRSLPRSSVVARLASGRKIGCRVVRVGCGLIVRLVTRIAVCRNGRVVVVHVATGTGHGRVLARERERGVVVIEGRGLPCGRVMANLALLREARLDVVRVRGGIEIGQVARDTCRAGQVVVSVDVTLSTLQWEVRSGQREPGRSVIESRSRPGRRGMAGIASGREFRLHVIRIGRGLVVLSVTRRAGACGQAVVPIYVALRTLQRNMRAGQRKPGGRMIKSCGPGNGGVAALAGLRKSGLHVVRIGRTLKIFQVA